MEEEMPVPAAMVLVKWFKTVLLTKQLQRVYRMIILYPSFY